MSAPAPPRPRTPDDPPAARASAPTPPWWRSLLAPVGSGVSVLLAGAAVGSVVQGGAWFGYALAAVAVVVLVGTLLLRTKPWLVAPGQLVALLLLVTPLFTGSAVFAVVPGPDAFGELGTLLSGAGDQIHTGIPPVPASPEILLLLTLAFGVLTIAVFGIAVTAESPAAAGVPLLCVFAVPTALDEQLLPWWSAVAAAAGFGVLLLVRGERLRQLPGGAAITALAVVGALLLGSAATMVGTAGRFDAGASGGADGSIGLNPFTSLRGQLNRPEPRDLFSVDGLEQPTYMRALTLQRYVPQQGWVAGRPLPGVGLAGPLPPSTSGPSTEATAQVRNLGFRDYWLPLFGDPVSVNGPSATDWSYDAAGGIAYANRPQQEDQWTERLRLPTPSADALRAASGRSGVDPSYLDTSGVDNRVTAIARQVTASAPTPFDKAMALNEYFTGPNSQFTYNLQTAPGAGGDALVEFLTRGRTGYCEQFASAMAVMLRTVGVPARVAVGFTAGQQGPDGRTISTSDAHAWVEAWFPGYGWQTFDPTPLTDGRTVEPQYVQQARAEAGGANGQDAQEAPPPPPAPDSAAPTPGAAPTPEPAPGEDAAPEPVARSSGVLPVVLAVALALVVIALVLAGPTVLRRRQTRRRTGLARAGGAGAAGAAWAEILAVSRDHGVAARRGDTVRTTAERMITGHELEGRGRDSLVELGRQVEASWYGGRLPEPGMLDPLVADVRSAITARGVPLGSRLVPPSVRPSGDDDAASRSGVTGVLLGAWDRVRRLVRSRLPGRTAPAENADETPATGQAPASDDGASRSGSHRETPAR
ncbi:transglutaminaseTgpA domain-containing protein [Pseudonocardia endophytica]|uniref:Transglutaminase-like putative cysteine protease n=1 Tax=Pseudonocardia endophytica TaxID=401976 RepID=A0A4V2PIK7_PSEEN|nr:DUF3488 and transglutaminase-like domain-containing protein [Pseudonocardia endophytica]TCK25046.1 transglutaminase-like putative cysteine protease [Pseudonocardia endophytica]